MFVKQGLAKMKRISALLSGILMLALNITATAQKNTDNKSLLWHISGKGLEKSSYLFGTIHQICQDDYVWTDKMKASLEKSEKICFEMDMDDPTLMMQVAMGLMDKSGKALKDYFTPEQYEHIKKYMKDSLGMDIAMFAQMKPVALESIISMKDGKCDNPVSYEETIMKTAQNDKKEILGLEAPKEQLDVLETIPVDSVIKDLLDAVEHRANNDDSEYNKLIAAYKQQDLPTLFQLIKNSKELGDGMDAFLDTRNKKWIPRMAEMMKNNSVFFAVGAGHLWGDNGVINLLRKEGYKVEMVK